jgi:hypothetical protein
MRAMRAFVVLGATAAMWLACGGDPSASSTAPSPCAHDVDCGAGRYCTPAAVCRSDCTDDRHCIGLPSGAQCNAHGRCIVPVVDAGPAPEASIEAGGA